ncbi:MAG TPA: VWA domain-containing protein [Acidimicrobiales bacterium]|nr:VWA domain-containing protein [Acidimicrobiales bacterium]
MTFTIAWRLVFLLAVLALLAAYLVALRRRPKDVVRFTNVALLDVVAPQRPDWRRHVPPALFLAALTVLVLGFARPVRATQVPDERATLVLAIDTSLSMEADDVEPDRLAVARAAALDFVDELPQEVNLGLVTFNGVARVAVSPGDDRAAVTSAIDQMELGRATAIGEAIFTALDAIESAPGAAGGEPAPARIVLMSDGETTVGRPDADAAAAAAEQGVTIYTIAFGTSAGTIDLPDGGQQAVPVLPGPLRDIATATNGRSYEAASLPELSEVYGDIGSVVGYRDVDRDISGWFIGLGLVFLAAAAAGSLAWSQRLP